jgi:hypothetical protein
MNKNAKFFDFSALLTDPARVMGGHMSAQTSGSSIRHLGAILSGLLLTFGSGATALGAQSPEGCNANRLFIDIAHDVSIITSGQQVNHRVTIANPGPGSGLACDVTNVDIVFQCPGPDGTPTGTATTLTTTGNYPADGSGNACYSFDGSGGCQANPGLSCTVNVNPGVLQANAMVQAGDPAMTDMTMGALHDVPGESAFSYNKQMGVAVVECFTVADCNDNLFCMDDACVSNVCQHTAHSCPADSNLCTTESCDENADACVSSAPPSCADTDICTDDSCVPATGLCQHTFDVTNDPSCSSPAGLPGRMTGGGSLFETAKIRSSKTEGRVTHGFDLHCDPEIGPNNLEVNWSGNHFHMEELLTAVCTDDPVIEPPPPGVDFDTFDGTGTGRCNGEAGASITFQFTDAGEPGTADHATINITGCPGGLNLSVSGFLKKGNHQAHRH